MSGNSVECAAMAPYSTFMDIETLSLAANMISSFEGCKLEPYLCPAGRWSIGFGNTHLANGQPVTSDTPPLTEEMAWDLLKKQIATLEAKIKKSVVIELNAHECAAFISLSYNIGFSAFRASTVLKRFNNGDRAGAAEAFLWWDKTHQPGKKKSIVLPGLRERRQKERAVFLGGSFEE